MALAGCRQQCLTRLDKAVHCCRPATCLYRLRQEHLINGGSKRQHDVGSGSMTALQAVPQQSAAMAAAADTVAAGQRLSIIARGFVGQSNSLAEQYHSTDFDWHEHAQQTAPLVEAQWAAAPAAVQQAATLDAQGQLLSAVAELLQKLQADRLDSSSSRSVAVTTHSQPFSSSCTPAAAAGAESCNPAVALESTAAAAGSQGKAHSHPASTGNAASSASEAGTNEWELFYCAHPAAKFFKERRYLLLEFPCLALPSELQHVVEIGAGCGSSILPVLRAQPQARATLSDISGTCLQQLLQAMQHLCLDSSRVDTFTADGTSAELGQRLAGCNADVALIMFTLSAVVPEGMLGMMRNAAASLRPGGLLCIRDHALYDMVQLRIPADQCTGRHLYRRGDGTLAYFYTTQELAGLAAAAGLEVVECEYVCVVNKNRKTGQALRRAFVHGVFRKPADAAAAAASS